MRSEPCRDVIVAEICESDFFIRPKEKVVGGGRESSVPHPHSNLHVSVYLQL